MFRSQGRALELNAAPPARSSARSDGVSAFYSEKKSLHLGKKKSFAYNMQAGLP